MNDKGEGEILFERRSNVGIITLNRPSTLNALNHDMIRAISRTLSEWERDDSVRSVIIKGNGRAFCAGGDIVAVYKAVRAGERPIGFFADEYRLNAAIARFPKPFVALIDGIVMGGGVGVSFHGSHRVLTEKALFAMPEVGIGFYPDIGGSYLLSRLPNNYGMYLALTGNRIGHDEAMQVGLGTHMVDSDDLGGVLDELVETGDPDSSLTRNASGQAVEENAKLSDIERHFSRDTLDACIESLKEAASRGDEFAEETLEIIEKRSPTSLYVTFEQVRRGASLSMDDCVRMEYRITNRMLDGHDFYEGVRAALIDKTQAPVWEPGLRKEIDPATVKSYFAQLGEEELQL
ncbi:enoyl-CoA hydratase/isomerase family protein [Chelativorans sp. YIM 93263]|uniref:enoyl-CoA hydratase/isomerase family protein n=1 Tax=Chelativorans sp. YIM 93263 TaxID=2906648 RepID=UPI002379731B|nr:enoyl-CoA hydratase/isomerase family protein [Chelativorans sp. YIM 93263]